MSQNTDTEHDSTRLPVRVVGLTGGIAAGKTSVSGHLAVLGAHIIDADSIGHEVLLPGGEAYADVVAAFGEEIVAPDGTIVRQKLGAIVFSDPAQLERLNRISHPHMAARMRKRIDEARAAAPPPPLIVLDAAILLQAGWDALCDEVWTVSAEPETAVARLAERNGLTPEDARARLDAQWSNAQREAKAQRVIHNEGSLEVLRQAVTQIWAETVETA